MHSHLDTTSGLQPQPQPATVPAQALEPAELRALEVQHPSLRERIGNFVEGMRLNNRALGARGAAMLVLGSSMAMIPAFGQVIILDHGLAENAQGRKGFGSYDAGPTSKARSADEFILNSDMNLTKFTVAGYADLGGDEGQISQMSGWEVTLFRWNGSGYNNYDIPNAAASYLTPSNSNYTDNLGTSFGGQSLHNVFFDLTGKLGFQGLTPGKYLICVTAGATQTGGLFRHSSSIVGDQLSNYCKRPAFNEWRQTLGEAGADFTPGTVRLEGSPVPEPATIGVLAGGLFPLLRSRRISRISFHLPIRVRCSTRKRFQK